MMEQGQIFSRRLRDDGLADDQRSGDPQPIGEESDGRGHRPLLRREPCGRERRGGGEVHHAGEGVQERREVDDAEESQV